MRLLTSATSNHWPAYIRLYNSSPWQEEGRRESVDMVTVRGDVGWSTENLGRRRGG